MNCISKKIEKVLDFYFEIKPFESKRLYELFGILYFKKFLLWLAKIIFRKDRGGYFLEEYSYKGIKKYIQMSKSFEYWHLFSIVVCFVCFEHMFTFIVCIILNLYCIMLQRYNRLRIYKIISKYNK